MSKYDNMFSFESMYIMYTVYDINDHYDYVDKYSIKEYLSTNKSYRRSLSNYHEEPIYLNKDIIDEMMLDKDNIKILDDLNNGNYIIDKISLRYCSMVENKEGSNIGFLIYPSSAEVNLDDFEIISEIYRPDGIRFIIENEWLKNYNVIEYFRFQKLKKLKKINV